MRICLNTFCANNFLCGQAVPLRSQATDLCFVLTTFLPLDFHQYQFTLRVWNCEGGSRAWQQESGEFAAQNAEQNSWYRAGIIPGFAPSEPVGQTLSSCKQPQDCTFHRSCKHLYHLAQQPRAEMQHFTSSGGVPPDLYPPSEQAEPGAFFTN